MAIDTTNLMQQVYDFFDTLYKASSPKAFLVFQKLGLPVNPADVPNANDAAEYTSNLANYPLIISNDTAWQDRTRAVYKDMEGMLQSSQPTDAAAMDALGAAKQAGSTELGISLGSTTGIVDYVIHPVLANPVNWHEPSQTTNWSSYSVGQLAPKTPPAPPPPPPVHLAPPPPTSSAPPPRIAVRPVTWHVLPQELHPLLARPVTGLTMALQRPGMLTSVVQPRIHAALGLVATPPRIISVPAPAHPIVAAHPAAPVLPHLATQVVAHPAAPVLAHPVAAMPIAAPVKLNLGVSQLHLMLDNVATIHANTTDQTVSSASMSIAFDYCIVSLGWPWLPNEFLMQRNWYLQNYQRGEYSNGTGNADPGLLPVLPTGFIAVRNLKITAHWTQQDVTAIQTTAGLNAFSLTGSSFDAASGILSSPGIQIIGWFCSSLPVLPPCADPTLPPPASVPVAPEAVAVGAH